MARRKKSIVGNVFWPVISAIGGLYILNRVLKTSFLGVTGLPSDMVTLVIKELEEKYSEEFIQQDDNGSDSHFFYSDSVEIEVYKNINQANELALIDAMYQCDNDQVEAKKCLKENGAAFYLSKDNKQINFSNGAVGYRQD